MLLQVLFVDASFVVVIVDVTRTSVVNVLVFVDAGSCCSRRRCCCRCGRWGRSASNLYVRMLRKSFCQAIEEDFVGRVRKRWACLGRIGRQGWVGWRGQGRQIRIVGTANLEHYNEDIINSYVKTDFDLFRKPTSLPNWTFNIPRLYLPQVPSYTNLGDI